MPIPEPDVTIRRSLVATATIQELLNGPLFGAGGENPPDAGGPRIDPESVAIESRTITFTTSAPVAPSSLTSESIAVTVFDEAHGWSAIEFTPNADATATTITLDLKQDAAEDRTIRLLVRGTGPGPVLGQNLIPLAGAIGGPAGSTNDGHDFVLMGKRS
jgi:hypothetical protein